MSKDVKFCAGRIATSVFLFVSSFALLWGCGGLNRALPAPTANTDSGGGTGGSGPTTGSTVMVINLGEFGEIPERIVALYLTVDSVKLHSPQGDVGLLSEPRRLEFSSQKLEPLLLSSVPQGEYNGVTVNLSNPVISFIDANGVLHEKVAATLNSSTVTNSNEFGFDSSPAGIDFNLRFDTSLGDSNAVSVTPRLNLSVGVKPIRDILGRVLGTKGQTFIIDVDAFRDTLDPSSIEGAFSFTADSSTELRGIAAIGDLVPGATVKVDAVLRSDGSFLATKTEVESTDPNAVVVDGLTLEVATSQLQMVQRQVHGPNSVNRPEAGEVLTAGFNNLTHFRVDGDQVDVANLDFTPAFDALSIARGQNIRVSSASYSTTAAAADWITLEPQSVDGIAGTVANGSVAGQSSFLLNLPAGSTLEQLTGDTSILVTVQPSTQKFLYFGSEDCLTCINGGNVRVRGLLFFSGGQYRLVAEWLAVL